MFIIDVSAHSLSMEESEFQKHMESARLATQVSIASPSSSHGLPTSARANQEETDMAGLLTILFNLFGEVCLTMNLHSKIVCFLPPSKMCSFLLENNMMWLLLRSYSGTTLPIK
jgi:hypothetical protein